MQVLPGARRSLVNRVGTTTTVTVPARRSPVTTIFLVAWLGGWSVGGYAAFQHSIDSLSKGRPDWFLLFWLIGWAVGEVYAIGVLAYILAGREVVSLSPGAFSVRLSSFGIGRTWDYEADHVRALRVAPLPSTRGNEWSGVIAFDYGARTIRFARDIDEAEASMVIQDLLGTGLLPAASSAALNS